jgi:hypothetical protein
METRVKKQKIVDEAQQQMDPLRSAMKEHLLQELMFQHFTGNEIKQLFEVSPLWNEIASKSKKCGEKLKLKIQNQDKAKKLKSIKASGRKYAGLELWWYKGDDGFVKTRPLLLDIVSSIGWNLKKFDVFCQMDIKDFVQLVSSLRNLKSLFVLGKIISNSVQPLPPLQLPKLQDFKGNILQPQFLELLGDVKTLETFLLVSVDGEKIDIGMLEDFILRQDKLKNFHLCFRTEETRQKLFADKNRLKEVKFKLETIGIKFSTIHPNSTENFFKEQQSLKAVDFIDDQPTFAETPEEHLQVLRLILTLPKLETLKILERNINKDWIEFQDIRNPSVKFLELKLDERGTEIHGKTVEMFPNLQKISVTPDLLINLRLEDVRCEKLSLINLNYLLEVVYEPPLIDFDQAFFEANFEEFLVKHRSIDSLMIGSNDWIANDIKLSQNFWERILHQLPKLIALTIFHPGNLIELVNLFNNTLHIFRTVRIFTNNIGEESVKEIELPYWMNIYFVE